jgi:hypothetical protein
VAVVLSCAHPEKAVTEETTASSVFFVIVMRKASKLNWRMPQDHGR